MFYRIAWNVPVNTTQPAMEALCNHLKTIGINAFTTNYPLKKAESWGGVKKFWKEGEYEAYDNVFNAAAECGVKVFWHVPIPALDWGNPNLGNQKFLERYKTFSACGGWIWGDPPGCSRAHSALEAAYNKMKTQDPNHSAFAAWSYNLGGCYAATYSGGHGCDTYDIGCQSIHPYALSEDPETFLRDWIEYAMHLPSEEDPLDGFSDCGKGMIPVIQAFAQDLSGENPDWKQHLIDQYDIWKEYYPFSTDVMKGIGFYDYRSFMWGNCPWQVKMREAISDISTATGWTE